MTTAGLQRGGSTSSVWRMALDAYRTLAANGRTAVMVSVIPAILMVIGSAAISWLAFGDPFLEAEDTEQISGSRILPFIPQAALYVLGSLIAFVPWIRIVLGLQPATLVAFLPQHLKVAPVWLLAWVVVPLAAGLALSVLIIPLMIISMIAGDGAAHAPAGDDMPAVAGYLIGALTLAATTFATAPFLLRAALISADLRSSAIAPLVLGRWVRVGVALIVATAPVMAAGLVVGQAFQSIGWIVHAIGVVDVLLFTLIQGAVCADILRTAGVREAHG